MYLTNFNKKEVRVKSFTRKGKIVKGYNRFTDLLVKTDDKGKKKLTNTSKALISLGSVAALGVGYKNRRLVADLLHKAGKKIDSDAISEKVTTTLGKPVTKGSAAVMMAPYKNAPDLTPEELKQVKSTIERNIKQGDRLTTSATGDEFYNLRDRRLSKNKTKLEKRKMNARGLIGGYGNYDDADDLYLQISKNRRNAQGVTDKGKLNDSRQQRKQMAKQLRQRLGGNFSKRLRLNFF